MLSSKDDLREPEARNVLGSFLFVGDDVHKPVKVLLEARELAWL
jgi:ATPase subunit of ABC transporter with duplicated ATPase domains